MLPTICFIAGVITGAALVLCMAALAAESFDGIDTDSEML